MESARHVYDDGRCRIVIDPSGHRGPGVEKAPEGRHEADLGDYHALRVLMESLIRRGRVYPVCIDRYAPDLRT